MDGKTHYVKAENLLEAAANANAASEHCTKLLRQAQVHATLARAMATLVGMEAADWDGAQ